MSTMGNDENTHPTLFKKDLAEDPFEQFGKWLAEAQAQSDITDAEPETMTLATVAKDGKPCARIMMLRGYDQRGFLFYTNPNSPKARQLVDNPHATLLFYWDRLGRQVRIVGEVTRVPREDAVAFFQNRPKAKRLADLVGEQSAVIGSRHELEEKLGQLEIEYRDKDIPLPPDLGGYRLLPLSFEFWQADPRRLHDRFLYTRNPDGRWQIERLSP
jgi:pyridoxamine 5'-phosphate oxidase